jgi:hypothetical protein
MKTEQGAVLEKRKRESAVEIGNDVAGSRKAGETEVIEKSSEQLEVMTPAPQEGEGDLKMQ